jgi:hypothetical protein
MSTIRLIAMGAAGALIGSTPAWAIVILEKMG